MRRTRLKRNYLVGQLGHHFKRFYGDFFNYVTGYGVKLTSKCPPFSSLKDHIRLDRYNSLELTTKEYCYYSGCFDNYSILFSDLISLGGNFSGLHFHGPYDEKEILNPNNDIDDTGFQIYFLFSEHKKYYAKIEKFKEIVYSSNLGNEKEIKKNFGFYAVYIDL